VTTGYTNLFLDLWPRALTIYFIIDLIHSTYGRGFIAVHDEVAARRWDQHHPVQGDGVRHRRVRRRRRRALRAFKQFLTPGGFDFISPQIVMVILGGMGNTVGGAGGVLLTLLRVLRPVAEYRMALYSLLLIILMLTCPNGLFAAVGGGCGAVSTQRHRVPGMKAAASLPERRGLPCGSAASSRSRRWTWRWGTRVGGPDRTQRRRENDRVQPHHRRLSAHRGRSGSAARRSPASDLTGSPNTGSRTFQNVRLFPSLSVFDNVRVAFTSMS
jgi:hypothetical protein